MDPVPESQVLSDYSQQTSEQKFEKNVGNVHQSMIELSHNFGRNVNFIDSEEKKQNNDNDSNPPMSQKRQARLPSLSVDVFNKRLKQNQKNVTATGGYTTTGDGNVYAILDHGLDGLFLFSALYSHWDTPGGLYNSYVTPGGDNEEPLLGQNVNDKQLSDRDKCTFGETALNSIGYMLGMVILSIPYVVASCGFGALIIMFVICVCTLTSALILDELLDYYDDINNYSDLVEHILGKQGKLLCAILTFIELYLYTIGSIIFAGDLLYGLDTSMDWIENHITFLRVFTSTDCIIIMGLIMMPLCHLTDLRPLSRLSGCGLFGIIGTYIMVIIISIKTQINGDAVFDVTSSSAIEKVFNINNLFTNVFEFGYGIGIIIAVFCLHTLMPNLKRGMRKPKQFRKIIFIIWCVVTPLLLIIGLCGYLTYGDEVDDSVTSNFTGIYSVIVLFLMIIKCSSATASCLFPVTLLVHGYVGQTACVNPKIKSKKYGEFIDDEEESKDNHDVAAEDKNHRDENGSKTLTFRQRVAKFLVPTCLVLIAIIIGVSVSSFAFVCNLAGSICALAMSIIFPCVMYIKVMRKRLSKNDNDDNNEVNDDAYDDHESVGKIYAKMAMAVGVLVTMVSLAAWNLVSLVYYGP